MTHFQTVACYQVRRHYPNALSAGHWVGWEQPATGL